MKFLKTFFKNLLILLAAVAVIAVLNFWYLGGFSKLEVKEQIMGPYTMAYKSFVGEYSKSGPAMEEVYQALSGVGIMSATGVGIYYDDPTVVLWENLRSDVGEVVIGEDITKVPQQDGIKLQNIAGKQSMVVEFPIKNTASYMVGVFKAYPVLQKYMQEKWYNNKVPVMELYDMIAKKIYYVIEIEIQ